MQLLIVESPNKSKKLQEILDRLYGAGTWKVTASYGHIMDLPASQLGVNRSASYVVSYEVNADKQKQVSFLKSLVSQAGKSQVYLATDPDREGEAIAMHLARTLGLDPATAKRVTFQEISDKALRAALEKPRLIDRQLVNAQEARRVIDRIAGYEISNIVCRKLGGRYSAGRVQSPCLRLVDERERIIANFKPTVSFKLTARFVTPSGEALSASYHRPFESENELHAYLMGVSGKAYRVASVEKKPVEKTPQPPFTTSTLQQDGIKRLSGKAGRWTAKKVMDVAQELFAGGHITYMRTDSPNLSEEAVEAIRQQLSQTLGAAYFQARQYAAKAGAQEAHEAIRPTHFEHAQAGETDEQRALYRLIYDRAVASQMASARLEQTVITITSAEPTDRFVAKASVVIFPGYKAIYDDPAGNADTDNGEEPPGALQRPVVTGDALSVNQMSGRQTFTTPPKRFDEATLVAELEKKGIGRPSTYASILDNIIARKAYVVPATVAPLKTPVSVLTWQAGAISKTMASQSIGADKDKLMPSETGRQIVAYLEESFGDIVDYSFTAGMEDRLDKISQAADSYLAVVTAFDTRHRALLEQAESSRPDAERVQTTRLVGDLAGLPVRVGTGKFGTYVLFQDEFHKAGDYTPDQINLELASQLISQSKQRKQASQASVLRTVGKFTVRQGEYGYYVSDGVNRASLPKHYQTRQQIDTLTAKECNQLINDYIAYKKKQAAGSSSQKPGSKTGSRR